MYVNDWSAADTFVQGGRSKIDRPIENNTRIVKRGDDYAVKLHGTDVVTFHKDGSVTLDSGGWLTVTTKARMNHYLGDRARVWSDRGKWFVHRFPQFIERVRYFDGIRIAQDGTILNPPDPALEERKAEAENKMRRRIDSYANAYMKELETGMPVPSGGDCWSCSMFERAGMGSNDHLLDHLTEKYYVPTLIWNAMSERGYRDISLTMSVYLDYKAYESGTMRLARVWNSDQPDKHARKKLRQALGKYLRKRLIPTVAV